jgi:hypothetical protein
MPYKKGSQSKRMRAVFTFSEKVFPPIQSFEIANSKCLPPDMNERVMAVVNKHFAGQPTGLAALTAVREEIESWYMARGFSYSSLKQFEGLDTGHIRLTVSEPKVRGVIVRFMDEDMQEKADPATVPVDLVLRTISLRPGQFYSATDGRAALQEAFTLNVCSPCQPCPAQ